MNILGRSFSCIQAFKKSNLKLTIYFRPVGTVMYRLDVFYVRKRKYFAYENTYDLKIDGFKKI